MQKQTAAKPTDDALLAKKTESKDAKEAEFGDKNKSSEARNNEVAKTSTDSIAPPPPAPKMMPAQPSITVQRKEEELPLNTRRAKNEQDEKKRDRELSGAANNSRQISGKTFNRIGGVWVDSAYNRSNGGNMALPQTKTIRRGSSEYQKLDKQVRIIAESLDGAVIIVWRGGAYRIQ